MEAVFLNEIYKNLFSTTVVLILLALIYLSARIAINKQTEGLRHRRRLRIRLFYILCVVFVFFMARIWVEGFTHLIAILGLVSAALVITNKETIMNFVGWLIIMWRSLFSEDDLIQIQNYKGYVKSIGLLYFVVAQVGENSSNIVTGKIIKVPNGLVANNALINYTQNIHLLEQNTHTIVTKNSDVDDACKLFKQAVVTAVDEVYKSKKQYSLDYLKKYNRSIIDSISLEPVVTFKPKLNKPCGIEINARYYCFANDYENLEQKIWQELLALIKNNPNVELAFET